jgi:hypothetical protein
MRCWGSDLGAPASRRLFLSSVVRWGWLRRRFHAKTRSRLDAKKGRVRVCEGWVFHLAFCRSKDDTWNFVSWIFGRALRFIFWKMTLSSLFLRLFSFGNVCASWARLAFFVDRVRGTRPAVPFRAGLTRRAPAWQVRRAFIQFSSRWQSRLRLEHNKNSLSVQ